MPETHHHKAFPARLAFVLNNPLRRLLQPPEQLISKLSIGADQVVVDFGCGPGFFLIPIARVAKKAIGVDVSAGMLQKAAKNAKQSKINLELLQSDGTEISLDDDSVDLILLNHVFHEVEDQSRVLDEFYRILKPSGRLAIVERTRGSRMMANIGPPVINETELIKQIQQSKFAYTNTIQHGSGSIIVCQKNPDSQTNNEA